ncbi:hypothetical protein TKK_0003045 [Trichogramma kaykai]
MNPFLLVEADEIPTGDWMSLARPCPPFSELPSDPFDLLERELYPTLDSPIVGPVALKPALKSFHFPSFWKHSPELWIDTIEENFRLLGVTNDHEKYIHTMSSLGGDVIAEISNAERNLPRVGRFAALKKALLLKYAVHDKVQLGRFLEALDKAKHKLPSEFLDILAGVGSRFLDRSSILKWWSLRLPPQISIHLDSHVDSGNEAYSQCGDLSGSQQVLGGYCERVVELSATLARLEAPQSNREEKSRNTDAGNSSSTYCTYHSRFGHDAINCRDPCDYYRDFPEAKNAESPGPSKKR